MTARRFHKDRRHELPLEHAQLHAGELPWDRRHLLWVGPGAVIDAFHRRLRNQAVQEMLLTDIDTQLRRFESGEAENSTGQNDDK